MTTDNLLSGQRDPTWPTRIGPYHILTFLGEGGMGTVFVAEQKEPVHRRVAVKIIKSGMDSRQVLARFESERQALAMMNHPNIAKVLDAGATERGQPYFVMEMVKGTPITEYCDKNRLSVSTRLDLFRQVCMGVQHAHHKGVMHRDLKPSNIMVEMQDGKPVAKIIDFGLARAVDHRLTDKTLFTEPGQILGTPEYMSPEQAEMSGTDIDTRTDVYSLGVLLYELLVGELPYGSADLRRVGYLEIKRRIREEVPPKPSTRVTRLGEKSLNTAQSRDLDPQTLVRELRGDLDWITMKALEKDRARRYQTPTELAADLERHLHHEPVTAGPPRLSYRLQKLVRKYRVQVAAGSAVLLALVSGLVVSLRLYRDAETARRAAEENERQANAARSAAVQLEREALRSKEDYDRLADGVRLEKLLRQADDDLWPERPEGVPAMDAWLAAARRLAETLPEHAGALAQILARASNRAGTAAQFADVRLQFQHDQLDRLVKALQAFNDPETGKIARVQLRRDWAESVRRRSVDQFRAKWNEAIAAIEQSAEYGHLRLTPQIGLVPVGEDPKSHLWEFVHPRSGKPAHLPARSATGLNIDEDTGIVFVLLPGRTFRMGASRNPGDANHDPYCEKNEAPAHDVTLAPFFLAKFEMTQAQWMALSGDANPSHHAPGGEDAQHENVTLLNPVENVDWRSCERLLRHHGLQLPTEAQWEYGCRGGTSTPWWTGAERESLVADGCALNIADASAKAVGAPFASEQWPEFDDDHVLHAAVGTYRANGFGLHDVHGNVCEWCRDAYGRFDEATERAGDGERIYAASRPERVLRGGSFANTVLDARASCRRARGPSQGYDNIGVRPARAIEP